MNEDTATLRAQRDEGSALTLAIVFITVVGLAMTLALGYASTTIKATANAFAPARDKLYAADAAAKAAVQYVRSNKAEGTYTAANTCSPLRSYGSVRNQAVTVQVCPQPNSFTAKATTTDWGLLTLATGSEKGVEITGQGGAQVNGNMYVNSSVDVANNSRLDVVGGQVKATGGCNRNVYVDGVLLNSCTVSGSPAADPAYTIGLTARPANGTGSCNTSTKIATLGPGTWTSSSFATALGSCDYVQLQSGIHYLEDVTWTIKNKVVAGDLNGSITTSTFGTSCKQDVNGATIVLGGTSNITLSGSNPSLEVCGATYTQSGGKNVQIPLFALSADLTITGAGGTLVTSSKSNGDDWDNEDKAGAVDGSSASVTLSKNKSSKDLFIPGWNVSGGGTIPSGVTQLTAVVRAAVSNDAATFIVKVRNNGESTTACSSSNTALPVSATVSSSTDTTVTLTCTKALVAPLTVVLDTDTSNSGNNRTIRIDGVRSLTYAGVTTVAVKAGSGCYVQAGSNCAVLNSQGTDKYMFFDGEVYLPQMRIDIQLPNQSTALSTLGIVIRSIKLATSGSTAVIPIVATENGQINAGDVVVTANVGGVAWVTCRATFTVSGTTVTGSTITNCTRPS